MKPAFVFQLNIVATLRSSALLLLSISTLVIFVCIGCLIFNRSFAQIPLLGGGGATYCNPINIDYGYSPIPNFSEWGRHRATADPVIVNYKGDYYLFSTNQWGYWWSSDMLNWKFISKKFLRPWNETLNGNRVYDDLCAPAIGIIGDTMLVFGSTYTSNFTNCYTDHIHILCLLSKKIALMDLLEELKKRSSKWIKTQGDGYSNFYWQGGYGAFSVNPTERDVVIKYISNQHEHHKNIGFQDEYRVFLKKYNVDFDERYVWD